MMKLRLVGAFAAVLLVVILVLQNTHLITTRFLFFTITAPAALLIGISLLMGIAAGILVALAVSGRPGARKNSPE